MKAIRTARRVGEQHSKVNRGLTRPVVTDGVVDSDNVRVELSLNLRNLRSELVLVDVGSGYNRHAFIISDPPDLRPWLLPEGGMNRPPKCYR